MSPADGRPDSDEPPGDEVVVGRVGRPHGVRGEVTVEPRTDEPERRFAAGAQLRADRPGGGPPPAYSALTVEAIRWHQDRLLVRFRELGDRESAEAARGLVLHVAVRSDERPEDAEEYYDHQLRGLTVLTTDGASAGVVADVLHAGAQDLLVVRRAGRDDALVPFVTALVPEVDLDAGRLWVADRPGLLEPLPDDEPPGDAPADG
ncbi:MAG: rRNA processing protein RimM [Nocardioidaceae bacterium]|jgi:16S rRNA processing protein RimM|nr:rRNA processing protein RimM [Nocardioidaceae bacterium]